MNYEMTEHEAVKNGWGPNGEAQRKRGNGQTQRQTPRATLERRLEREMQ